MTWGFALAVITYWPVLTWLGTFRANPVMLTILALPSDPRYDGVRVDCGVPCRAFPGADSLQLRWPVAAIARRGEPRLYARADA